MRNEKSCTDFRVVENVDGKTESRNTSSGETVYKRGCAYTEDYNEFQSARNRRADLNDPTVQCSMTVTLANSYGTIP